MKSKRIFIRVTPEEKKKIEENAKKADKEVSKYLLDLGLNEKIKEVTYKIVSNGNKNNVCATRFTDEEYSIVEQKAKKANMTISKFLAYAAIKREIVVIDGIKELAHHLSKVGNNLNQLTMLAHQNRFPKNPDVDEIKKVVNEVWQLLNSLMAKTKRGKDSKEP